MKKIIILALVGLAGWQIYTRQNVPTITNADIETLSISSKGYEENFTFSDESFECDGRQHCSQMTSRAEAVYFVQNCPNTKMNGDYDGIPCENDSRF